MKIVSWNVAGFRACLKKGFAEFFANVDADAICLQEVKATAEEIDFAPEGYTLSLYPAEKKGYAGTLIYTRVAPLSVKYGVDIPEYDSEGRAITMEFNDFYLVNLYVPNVKRDLSRMDFRMKWEDEILKYLKKLEEKKPVVVCGDFNVAHQEIDIKNAKANIGNAGFTYEERDKFTNLLENGFIDTYRYFHPTEEGAYSWWTYMRNCRARNIGWRIDYFIISEKNIKRVKDTMIYQDVLGSDHCPIGIEVDFK